MENVSINIYLKNLFLIIFPAIILSQNTLIGLIGFFVAIAIMLLGYYENRIYKKREIEFIDNLAEEKENEVKNGVLFNLPKPFVLTDFKGNIKWYNSHFENIVEDKKIINKSISDYIEDINIDKLPKDDSVYKKEIAHNNKVYNIYTQLANQNNKHKERYILYFEEITDYKLLQKKYENEKTVVSLLFVDNYEEIIKSVEEIRRPLLIAYVDRKLNALAKDIDGILRKYENDKYILIFSQKKLESLKEDKFSILDDIKKANFGNSFPLTISMGMGIGGENLFQSMEYARASIDLALGRGGDQAIIKDSDNFSFYGGKSKNDVVNTTRVKSRMKALAFKELVSDSDEVLIMGHRNPDLDCLGSALGVYRIAKILGKEAHIVLNSSSTAIDALYNNIINDDNYEEDIFLSTIDAIGHSNPKTLLVIVDVNRPSYTECPEVIDLCKKVVLFDHHRRGTEFLNNTVLSYLEIYASSTCELVSEILLYIFDKLSINALEADAMLAGIMIDTKSFTLKTGVRTFEAAAFLRKNGADSTRVRTLFQNDMNSYKTRAEIIKNAEIFNGIIAISSCPDDLENPNLAAAQAADELLNISGVKASFVMSHSYEETIISARSLGEINVQLIMEKLGGGGHFTMAGAQLKSVSIYTAREKIKEAIMNYLKEGEK